MSPERVDIILSKYKHCTARSEYLKEELRAIEANLIMWKAYMKGNLIDDLALKAQQYERLNMPRGTDVSDPTAKLAIDAADGYKPKYIVDLEIDLNDARMELNEVETVIRFVNSWMIGLNSREAFIVEQFIIEQKTWREILVEYEDRFGQFGIEGLRKIKKRALSKIYGIAS